MLQVLHSTVVEALTSLKIREKIAEVGQFIR